MISQTPKAMCRIPTQTYCKILLSMCMCSSCDIYVALAVRGLIVIRFHRIFDFAIFSPKSLTIVLF